MAPDLEILKRKRNAPGSWWAAASAASPLPSQQSPIAPPRKKRNKPTNQKNAAVRRGQESDAVPGKSESSQISAIEHNANSDVSREGQEEAENLHEVVQERGSQQNMDSRLSKRKRSRPSNYWVVPPVEPNSSDEPPTKKQNTTSNENTGRRKKKREATASHQQTGKGSKATQSADPQGRGRPAKSKSSNIEQAKETEVGSISRRRLRLSQNVSEPDIVTATSSFSRSKPGQKRVAAVLPVDRSSKAASSNKSAKAGVTNQTTAGPGNKSRKPSTSTVEKQKDRNKSKDDSQLAKRRRSTQEYNSAQDIADDEELSPTFQRLAPVTHRVPRHAIEKWEPLPFSSIERISQMLGSAERPVIMHLYDERKRNQASTAIGMVTRRLVRKLSKKLPFPVKPTGTGEDDFDFENILNIKTALEAQLTPASHANELLRAELWKEKAFLDAEKADLADLESNAKSESQKRKQAERKAHVLLHLQDAEDQTLHDIGLDGERQHRQPPLNMSNDEGLTALLKEVHGHVDSLQGNVSQVEGISEAIAKSRAAVQATLFSHLDGDAYEAVALG